MRIGIARSRPSRTLAAGALLGMCAFLGLLFAQDRVEPGSGNRTEAAPFDNIIHAHAGNMLERAREIFRYDTFGSQDFGEARSSCIKQLKGPNWAASDRKQRWP